ncbi:MAG: hypothetical protein OXN89_03230 [Bryobacterales bacterium]|nr:hypothetical protein [Bryobacterales bacterium]
MTNKEFQSWLAAIDRLTHAQCGEAMHKLLDLALEDPIEDERSGAENTPCLRPDSRSGTRIDEVRWNARYEAAKPRLVKRLRAMLPFSGPGEIERAKATIAAVESLPLVGKHQGGLRIVNKSAHQLGSSDSYFWLGLNEHGFEPSSWESTKTGGGPTEFENRRVLVKCGPADQEPAEDDDEDLERTRFVRGVFEKQFGLRMSDEEWQMQVDAASEAYDEPNGILDWLEIIPM